MNRLLLVRHGESEHHVSGLTGGWTDTPLTPHGRKQAEATGKRCRELVADAPEIRLYSSDLLRAAQTAEYVAAAFGTEIRLEPGLREINNGIAVNMTWQEARAIELPATEPALHWIPYTDAESVFMMTERVFAALDRIDRECPATAVVVTHGIAGVAVLQWWLRLDKGSRVSANYHFDAASITTLGMDSRGERTILELNHTAHLAGFTGS